jgi:hypothetical protein
VSGEIRELDLPGRHGELTQPDMLARTWDVIPQWLRGT